MNAIVLINKPIGLRSTRCVEIVRKKFSDLKTGHAGTLDSTASGLLVLLLGRASRLSDYVMSLPKVYRARIQFGAETDTDDYSGEIISERGFENLDTKILYDALYSFLGWRLQNPPEISALKIDGERAYKLARSGHDVKIKSRPVFIKCIRILSPFDSHTGTLEIEVTCGKGTYIRSIARDLGKISGRGAYIKSLERISIGKFILDNANFIDADEFRITELDELARNFTRIYISERDEKSFMNGMSILLRQAERFSPGISNLRDIICVEGENFLGFGTYAGYDYVKPLVVVSKT